MKCPQKRLYGGTGDGGKWVCLPAGGPRTEPGCLVYSIGGNNNWEFEKALAKSEWGDCQIYTFDHTIYPIGKPQEVNFLPWGLARRLD